MKKFTSLFILMIFGSSVLFAQMTTREQIESQGRVTITDVDPAARVNSHHSPFVTDDLFDEQFQFICGDASGEAGVETNGDYIYTSLWNSEGFVCYEMDGTFLGTFPVPGESAVRDLAYDGTYFYGAAASTSLYEMDFVGQSGTLISTLTAAVATRACAYDAEFDAFWGNNWSDPITLYDRSGGILNQFNCGAYSSYYGFARLNDAGTEYLYGFAQSGGASQSVIVQIDPYTGAETGVTYDAIGFSSTGTGIAGGLAAFDTYAPGWWTLLGIIQNETIFGVEGGIAGPPPVLDLKLSGITEPNTGFGLGVEDIVIGVKNVGSETQSNFDVQYRVDGGAWITEMIPGPLAMGESIVHTFATPYDFTAFGEYFIEAEVILAGDENPDNNSGNKTIQNMDPSAFCNYSITMWDDYGDGWNGGYVQIFGDGVEFVNATLAAGAGPETIEFLVQDGSFLTAVWTAGGWPYECSYIVYDNNGDPIFEDGMGGVDPIGGDIGYAVCGPQVDPEITVDPLSFNVNLDPGATGQEYLNIGNIGAGGLNWNILVVNSPAETTLPTNVNAKAEPNASLTDKDPIANSDWDYDCPEGSLVSQPCPDYSTAMTADEAAGYDFYQSFAGGGDIQGLRFWGIDAIFDGGWAPCTGTEPKTFHIGFFADDAGQPGAMIDEFTIEVPRVNTGDLFASSYTMWEYEVVLPSSVYVMDGWFSVMAMTDPGNCWFLSLNAPSGSGTGQQWDGSAWNPQDPMGFCLLGEAVTPWLTVSPLSGTVDPQGSEVVTLDFNAGDHPVGTELMADLVLTSNDPVNPEIIIPVTMTVGSSVVTQNFDLETGYQFISTSVISPDPDMMVVMADVIGDNLDFVRNSSGAMLRKIGPNWVNGIGDWIIDEGYLVKMNADDSFAIEGQRIDPSTGIPVAIGFQFVSYFPETAMDALVAFETIIGDDLDFIRDSQGAMLRKIGPNWVNGIGDAMPGEGYLVKMLADGEIIYPAAAKSSGMTKVMPSHLIFEGGNAAEPVYTMYINGLEIGNEVAAYNGNVILGSMTVTSNNVYDNALAVFSQLTNGQGYVAGEAISLKIWSNDNVVVADFEMESVYNSYVSNVYPVNDGEFSVVNMTKGAELSGELVVYPNPATNMINISSPNQINNVVIFNYVGQSVYEGNSNQINTSNFDAGVYIIRIETTNGIETQKVTIN